MCWLVFCKLIKILNKLTSSVELKLKLDSFYDLTNEHWLPIYADNINWSHIEFVCEIELKLSLINDHLNLSNEYNYVRK